ncbi:DUF2867 domain-containing protein [Cellulomonas cellasea]|uniref:DUF2867 domain-containing protein n=1 Tax=Cellulomonas cellasea TaxID=43670 RepID=A0A7W4YAJ1_9CELL|nr:DUF2867 domain-containing protein [Cellulomonas cellasea]MBB2922658.1 hypothetical protein [Cellulomonas cellasea]
MRLPDAVHTSSPWRIHAIAPDFAVEDVWALATPGGTDELPRLVEAMFDGRFPDDAPLVVRALWSARERIGAALGWDRPDDGLGARVPSLRERLPADLRPRPGGPDPAPFTPLYATDDEWVAEIANRTVHAVLHLGWVPDGDGGHTGRMAVLVRPNGRLGAAYLAAIAPFRHLLVYPAMLRGIERRWRAGDAAPQRPSSPSMLFVFRSTR